MKCGGINSYVRSSVSALIKDSMIVGKRVLKVIIVS